MADEDTQVIDEELDSQEELDEDAVDTGVDDEVDDQDAEDTSEEDDSPSLDSSLLSRAEDYGLSKEDLSGFDEDKVERLLAKMDERIMSQSRDDGTVAGRSKPSEQPVVIDDDQDYEPLAVDLGDDLDEEVTKPIQNIVEHVNKELKEARQFRKAALQEFQAMNTLRELSEFDQFVSSMGDDWSSEYGEGSTLNLDPHSKQYKKRLDVFHGAKMLAADAARRGNTIRMIDVWKRSHQSVNFDRHAEMAQKRLDKKMSKRRKQSGERPSKGKSPALSPVQQAIAIMSKP